MASKRVTGYQTIPGKESEFRCAAPSWVLGKRKILHPPIDLDNCLGGEGFALFTLLT